MNARPALNVLHNTGVCLIQRLIRCAASIDMAKSAPRQVTAAIKS